MLTVTSSTPQTRVVLVGLESVGKTSLFAHLTNQRTGEETNAKGSTIFVKEQSFGQYTFVDTPGIRTDDHEMFTAVTKEIARADHIFLVVRGTHITEEIQLLLPYLANDLNRITVVVTFADRMNILVEKSLVKSFQSNQIPFVFVNLRQSIKKDREQLIHLISQGTNYQYIKSAIHKVKVDSTFTGHTWFDHRIFGAPLALIVLFMMFCIPVILSYQYASFIEAYVDIWLIEPLVNISNSWPEMIQRILVGNYGLLTLGVYSFVWAFPVVLLISIASALADDSGIKDRIVDALDPWMKRIGLNGQDLVPVITGFGCNVVAVHQTRGCSTKTRNQCVSMISFGSACSYQIGATLSIFHVANMQWMFIPYLLILTLVGALHNKIWFPIKDQKWSKYFHNQQRTFLQRPSFRGVWFRVKSVIYQFITQAMPIFLIICIMATLLDFVGILSQLTHLISPIMSLIGAPEQSGSGVIFSMIRKDGILLFNEGSGELLNSMTTGTIFLLVYLASTLSSCLVTLWTIVKELKSKIAFSLMVKQFATSIVSAGIILLIIRLFEF